MKFAARVIFVLRTSEISPAAKLRKKFAKANFNFIIITIRSVGNDALDILEVQTVPLFTMFAQTNPPGFSWVAKRRRGIE